MLTGLVQNLRLRAEARTGLSSAVVVFALIAAIAGLVAFVFFVFAGVHLAGRTLQPADGGADLGRRVRADRDPRARSAPCLRSAAPASAPSARWRCAASRRCSIPQRLVSRCRSAAPSDCAASRRWRRPVCSPPLLAKEWFAIDRTTCRRRTRRRAGKLGQRGGNAPGAFASAARAMPLSSSMRRTRSSMLSNFISGLIHSMNATSIVCP